MPHKPPSLRFDRHEGGWVENPKSRVQRMSNETDDYIGGLIVGVGIGGFLSLLVYGLALLI